eukprot:7339135-Pyramimonas_sp.AAC.1
MLLCVHELSAVVSLLLELSLLRAGCSIPRVPLDSSFQDVPSSSFTPSLPPFPLLAPWNGTVWRLSHP